MRCRRLGAHRCPSFECTHRDPLDCSAEPWPAPGTYGLDRPELVEHAAQLAADGWQPWEIHARLDLRPQPTRTMHDRTTCN